MTDTHLILTDAATRAARYLDDVARRPVRPDPEAVAALSALDVALPSHGRSASGVLARLDALGSPATMGMAGPRFFGFVIGGAMPATLAANYLKMKTTSVSAPAAVYCPRNPQASDDSRCVED